jgi:mannose-6-phosphate isomerase-like protein (cupin superfamily)
MQNLLLLSLVLALSSGALAQTAKPPAQTAKPPAPTAKPPVQTAKPPVRTAKPAAQPAGRAGVAITVTDASSATISDVTVELTGPTARSGVTDAGGQANFPGLQAGTYRLRFTGDTVIAFERELTLRAGQIAKLPITLSPAPAAREVAVAPAPPPAPVAPPPPAVGPIGQAQILSVISLVERELIANNAPRKDALIACSGNTRTMLVQLNESQAQRVYEGAETLYYVVAGEGAIAVDGRDTPLQAGVYASLPRGTIHAFTRKGRRPLILLAVLSGEPCEQAK